MPTESFITIQVSKFLQYLLSNFCLVYHLLSVITNWLQHSRETHSNENTCGGLNQPNLRSIFSENHLFCHLELNLFKESSTYFKIIVWLTEAHNCFLRSDISTILYRSLDYQLYLWSVFASSMHLIFSFYASVRVKMQIRGVFPVTS